MSTVNDVQFYINDTFFCLTEFRPEESLLDYIRSTGLKGVKGGCREGGCGACSVLATYYHPFYKKILSESIATCLIPLAKADGMVFTTSEGLGSVRGQLHPIQKALVENRGSQCGYCTPGFVVTLADYFDKPEHIKPENGEKHTDKDKKRILKDIEETLDGNLCRCTGYRGILNSAAVVIEHLDDPKVKEQLGESSPLHRARNHASELSHRASVSLTYLSPKNVSLSYGRTKPNPFSSQVWIRPVSLDELLKTRQEHPHADFASGCSEVGLQMVQHRQKKEQIDITHVPELHLLSLSERDVRGLDASSTDLQIPSLTSLADIPPTPLSSAQSFIMGSAATLAHTIDYADEIIKKNPFLPAARTFRGISSIAHVFSSYHIRKVATAVANISLSSPVSDMLPPLYALNTGVVCESSKTGRRVVPLPVFHVGNRRTDLHNDEVVTHLYIPITRPREYYRCYKQTRRQEDDISIANASFRFFLRPPTQEEKNTDSEDGSISFPRITEAMMAFGGMSWKVVSAPKTIAFLTNNGKGDRRFTRDVINEALTYLLEDLPLTPNAPGGQIRYRRTLCLSHLFKFFLETAQEIVHTHKNAPQDMEREWDDSVIAGVSTQFDDREATTSLYEHSPVTKGSEDYTVPKETKIVGQNVPHLQARVQTTGETLYAMDTEVNGKLYAAVVASTKGHAKIVSVDASEAVKVPGVVKYVSLSDVKGSNAIGPTIHDEECFAKEEVTCVGQVIGVIVAESDELAHVAATLVKVEYEDLPVINTIDDAIAADSYFTVPIEHTKGDLEKGFAESDRIFEGEIRMAGQIHVTLETQNTICIPGEDGSMEVIAATQNPSLTQRLVAKVIGTDHSNVHVIAKRIGGAFGGKESRSCYLSCAAAVAAQAVNRPVHIVLNRTEDMEQAGGRHPWLVRYKIGVKNDGKFVALDCNQYSNGGNTIDLSQGIMNRAVVHADNTYFFPHIRSYGRVCKTHRASNTAFRGFGAPQGCTIMELIVERVSREMNLDSIKLREMNFYKDDDRTHFGQEIMDCTIPKMWKNLLESSDYEKRRKEADEFNAKHKYIKRGLGVSTLKFGVSFESRFLNQANALVHLHQDGSVRLCHGGLEMGQGIHTKMAQIAAEVLGCDISQVHVADTSTDTCCNTSPTAASSGSDLNGMAVSVACHNLLDQLKPTMDANPGKTLAEIARIAYLNRVPLSARGHYATPTLAEGHPFAYFVFGGSVGEVEINTLNGNTKVIRVDAVYDCGKSLNPHLDIGQIEGAIVMGIGYYLLEEPFVGPDGKLINSNIGFYKIPGISNIPLELNVTLLRDSSNKFNSIFSSKAVGEPPLILSGSAYLAALDAIDAAKREHSKDSGPLLDRSVMHIPATNERVRMLIEDPMAKMTEQASVPLTTIPT
ncbi:Xanthine dehydrogenase [Blattamonas nauphoetae]|uniref:Xanthine dehydrogenase n=1 Tax=Blattamonas nauphoetae TaxID=2049346 RepID=A0ABQ9YCG5_9EUKA|nr:Xanthine dehydrogenase [Blattamonas nauphoetae]